MTQAALGAGWAEPAAPRARLGAAAALGALAGMAPDLDILIQSPTDPLLGLEFHRQFTHSLAFIPFGAAVCAVVFHGLFRRRLSFAQTYLFCLLGYASHGLLDAFTTYGTQLLWPFSSQRIAWHGVSVVDPLFSVPVLGLVALAAWRRRRGLAVAALAWAVVYLGLGLVQHERAEAATERLAAERGHVPVRLEAMPAFASIVLWRSIYEYDGRYYVDAIRVVTGAKVFEGGSVAKLDRHRDLPWLAPGTQQARDLERFRWFTDDYLGVSEDDPGYAVDLRYSFVPNDTAGLWGIRFEPGAGPDAHVKYLTARRRPTDEGWVLLRMLFDRFSST